MWGEGRGFKGIAKLFGSPLDSHTFLFIKHIWVTIPFLLYAMQRF